MQIEDTDSFFNFLRMQPELFVLMKMKCPQDAAASRAVASLFQSRWNVPHAVGAVDGKHIQIRKPADSGSLYHNYKGFFSILLMAVVDADYKFLWADLGGMGHQSDAQIFNDSEFKECLEEGVLNLPDLDPLPHDDCNMPYHLLGDDAFGLTP